MSPISVLQAVQRAVARSNLELNKHKLILEILNAHGADGLLAARTVEFTYNQKIQQVEMDFDHGTNLAEQISVPESYGEILAFLQRQQK